jgi:hypothetical protein
MQEYYQSRLCDVVFELKTASAVIEPPVLIADATEMPT